MASINTNVAAQMAANALAKNDRAMTQTMERLATGSRINSASDDAAGLAISSKLTRRSPALIKQSEMVTMPLRCFKRLTAR